MNKTETTLAAVGGASLVAVLAAGYFVWSQQSAKTAALEGDDAGTVGLESVQEKAERLSRKPVYPGSESVKALEESRASLVAWKDEAFEFAARGDRRMPPTTDAAFKEFIVGDARRLMSLPAGADHKTLAPTFDFGPFKPYISEGKMPEQDRLRELQRKWDDVATIIETLATNGVDAITAVDVRGLAQQAAGEAEKPKKGKKTKGKAKVRAAESAAFKPSSYTYLLTCRARPAEFVRALNALATGVRFMTVEDVAILREKDSVAEGLGVSEKKEESPATGRRRRRGAVAEAEAKSEEKPAEEALYATVSDPAAEPPLEVRLTVTVCDFRTLEENKEGEVEK